MSENPSFGWVLTLFAWVYDHGKRDYFKEYRGITIGWTNGNTFIPLICLPITFADEKQRLVSYQPPLITV